MFAKYLVILGIFISQIALAQDSELEGPYGQTLIGGYSFGVEYAPSINIHTFQYETPKDGPLPKFCQDKSDKRECFGVLSPSFNNSLGFVVTKQYVPKGLFVLDSGFDFSFHRYQANMELNSSKFSIEQDGVQLVDNGIDQPITSMSLDAYALATRYAGKIGLAPPFLPDVILSAGPGIETVYGTITINDEEFNELIFSPHFFGNIELVWARFLGKGSLSTYMDLQMNVSTNQGRVASIKTEDVSNLQMVTANISFGIMKLIMPI